MKKRINTNNSRCLYEQNTRFSRKNSKKKSPALGGLMTAAHVSHNVFPPSGFSPMYSVHFIVIHVKWHTFLLYCTLHSYIHSYNTHSCVTFISSFLHFFSSSWQAGCSRLFVSDTTYLRLLQNMHFYFLSVSCKNQFLLTGGFFLLKMRHIEYQNIKNFVLIFKRQISQVTNAY